MPLNRTTILGMLLAGICLVSLKFVLPAEAAVPQIAADDVVYVPGGDSGVSVLSYRGEVVSYLGDKLVIRLASGLERTLPGGENILRIDTLHSPEYLEAVGQYESGDFEQALSGFQRAMELENRAWVQRMILERIIYCHQNLGQWEQAGQRFLLLVSSDPNTPYFASIPLAWVADPPLASLEQQAQTWLSSSQPVAQLLGASHLLSTRRVEAEDALSQLRFNADQRVAALARMQLWRTDLHRVNLDRIASWSKELDRFPHLLRAGGYFLIGSGNVQVKRAEDAALDLMRVPIHYPEQRRLSARCLIEAGRQLEALGQMSEAQRLYTELIDEYNAFPESREAEQRLQKLPTGNGQGGNDQPAGQSLQ